MFVFSFPGLFMFSSGLVPAVPFVPVFFGFSVFRSFSFSSGEVCFARSALLWFWFSSGLVMLSSG